MMHHIITATLDWVAVHPVLALAMVFAVAVGESLFLFGLLVPGAIFMFAFGALIGAHTLPALTTFAVAIIGTLLGDTASYLLGRHYRGRLQELPGLSRIPGGVSRGEDFFARHGGISIILGRLIGALRPIMPTVAGAAGLSVLRFAIMEIIATALWAPIYIGPGIVFGASLDLAAQVATRLAMLLIIAAVIIWALTSLARFLIVAGRSAGERYAKRLLTWSRRHRRLGLLGPALADPRQPEIPALAVAAVILIIIVAAFKLLLWYLAGGQYPNGFDSLIFYLIDSLHNNPTTAVARVIALAGSPLIYLPFAVVIAVALSVMGNPRAASLWVAAIAFSSLATLLMRWLPATAPPAIFFNTSYAEPLYLAGGQDLVLCATVYGLIGMMLGARQPVFLRPYYYSGTVAGVVLIALARLYLGLEWASTSLVALLVAFIWLNLLMICYRRQRPRPIRTPPIAAILSGFVGLAVLLAVMGTYPLNWPHTDDDTTPTVIDWRHGGYTNLPAYVDTLRKRQGPPLNVQIAGTPEQIDTLLTTAGWLKPPHFNAVSALKSLAPNAPIDDLPVIPRMHAGQAATQVWVYPEGDARRWLLRLWPTKYTTMENDLPIWIASVDLQRVRHALYFIAVARDTGQYDEAVQFLAHDLTEHGLTYLPPADHRPLLLWIGTTEAMLR